MVNAEILRLQQSSSIGKEKFIDYLFQEKIIENVRKISKRTDFYPPIDINNFLKYNQKLTMEIFFAVKKECTNRFVLQSICETTLKNLRNFPNSEENIKIVNNYNAFYKDSDLFNNSIFDFSVILGKENIGNIKKEMNEEYHAEFIKDLAVLIYQNLEITQKFQNELSILFIELFKFREPILRYNLIAIIHDTLKSQEKINDFLILCENFSENNKKNTLVVKKLSLPTIASILVSSLELDFKNKDSIIDKIKGILFHKKVVNNAYATKIVFSVLIKLNRLSEFSNENKNYIIHYIFNSLKNIERRCYIINAIILLNEIECLNVLKNTKINSNSEEDIIHTFLKNIFKQKVGLNKKEEKFIKMYDKTMAVNESRGLELALIYYFAKVSDDKEADIVSDEKIITLIKRFAESFYDKNKFIADRYNVVNNHHLEVIKNNSQEVFEKWRIRNFEEKDFQSGITDDPVDLFLIGDETPTCISPFCVANPNKSLMSYVSDWKIKAAVIKDLKTHKILARSILKLLLDKNSNQPVLFMGQMYFVSNCDYRIKKWQNILCQVVLNYARWLNIPLLYSSCGGVEYPNDIISLGGIAPFEYVDIGKYKIAKDSIYTIPSHLFKKVEKLEDMKFMSKCCCSK